MLSQFYAEAGFLPFIALAVVATAIGLILTVGKCDMFGNIYH